MSLLEKFDNPQAERAWKVKVWKRIKAKHPDIEQVVLLTKEVFGEISLEGFSEYER